MNTTLHSANAYPLLRHTTTSGTAKAFPVALLCASVLAVSFPSHSAGLGEMLKSGDTIADFRLRYESNDTDDATDSATALTLRSRLGYETASLSGFKVLAEFEDVRAIIDEYRPENSDYDVVADPENSEFNRVQISYAKDGIHAVIGRQRIILDNARFIGNVGWRQNEQTFDAVKFGYKKDDLNLVYAFIDQVNSILFTDTDMSNHLLNVSYSGLPAGTISGYAYLLENDDTGATLDTFGVSFKGKYTLDSADILYRAEYATQTSETSAAEFDASYHLIEAGIKVSGLTLTAGNETLGSDNGEYGFDTPLATKHAFNGWADKFLGTGNDGLSDTYIKAAGVAYGTKLVAVYHDYSGDDSGDDRGSEVNILAARKINKQFSAGLKYADYSAGDSGSDTQKLWLWGQAKF